MAIGDFLQDEFTAGELSPRVRGRVSSALYRKGLASCVNWEVEPQGPIARRPGSGKLAGPLATDVRVRLAEFRVGNRQDFALEFCEGKLHVYDLSGQVATPIAAGDAELIRDGDLQSADTVAWPTLAALVTIGSGQMYLAPGGHTRQGIGLNAGDYVFTFAHRFQDTGGGGGGAGVHTRVRLGTTPGGSELGEAIYLHVDPSQTWTWPIHAAGPINVYVDVLALGVYGGNVQGPISLRSTTPPSFDLVSPWTLDQARDVQFACAPGSDTVYFAHPNVGPQQLAYSRAENTWVLSPAVFTAQPAKWTGTNWPGVIELYQGRLYLAATPAEGNWVWASRPGLPWDFTLEDLDSGGNPIVVPSNAIAEPLATAGRIQWLRGKQAMLVGTDLSEGSITAQGGAIAPGDFHFQEHTEFGSAPLQAVKAGDQVLHVSGDRRKVRAVDYDFGKQSYLAHDVSFIAEHLTSPLVKELHFAKDPHLTIVLVLQDGTMVCCTYDRGEEVIAWWRFVTDGVVCSACVANGPAGSLLYVAVQRSTGIYLELVSMSEVAPTRVYLDCAVTLDVPAGDTPVIPGLEYLLGKTVNIILDGALEPDQLVQTVAAVAADFPAWSGAIVYQPGAIVRYNLAGVDRVYQTSKQVQGDPPDVPLVGWAEIATWTGVKLERAGASVTIGLPYRSSAKMLKPSRPGAGGAPSPRNKQRWAKLFLRLNQSGLPLVDGERIEEGDRDPATPMDTPQPLFSGDFGPVSTMFEDEGAVLIEQDLPLRTEILALYGSLAESET